MPFSRVDNMPFINSYFTAKSVYESIKPIRGKTIRPLGRRSAKHYAIEKRGNDYVCTLYEYPVVTFADNGNHTTTVHVSLCGHDTMTTRGFISAVTGYDCYSHNGKTYIEVGNRTTEVDGKYKVTSAYYLPLNHTLQIHNARQEVLNPVPVMKKVLDREVTKELRDKYKEEMVAAESMLRLGTPRYGEEYDPRQRQFYFQGQFMVDLTSEEMSEYLWLVAGFDYSGDRIQVQKYTYNIQRQVSEPVGDPSPTYRSYIVNALYHIAALDAITIHKEVEMPVGQRA